MRVCCTCGSRDPRSEYEVKELTAVALTHCVRVPKMPLKRLRDELPIRLLRVPVKAAGEPAKKKGDEEEQPIEIEVRRHK